MNVAIRVPGTSNSMQEPTCSAWHRVYASYIWSGCLRNQAVKPPKGVARVAASSWRRATRKFNFNTLVCASSKFAASLVFENWEKLLWVWRC